MRIRRCVTLAFAFSCVMLTWACDQGAGTGQRGTKTTSRRSGGLLNKFESEGVRIVHKSNVADEEVISALSAAIGKPIPAESITLVLDAAGLEADGTGAAVCYYPDWEVKRGGRVLNPGYLVILRRGAIEEADRGFDDVMSVGIAVSDRGEVKVAQAGPGGDVERAWGEMRGQPATLVIVTLVR